MMIRQHLAALAIATAALGISGAMAADYDPPVYVEESPEYVPVEVGSGWYLRGDVAYTLQRQFTDTRIDFDEAIFTNEFIGVPPMGEIGINPNGFRAKENPISGSIGFGYHFNDYLRVDVNVGLLADDEVRASGYLNPDPNFPQQYGCLGTLTVETVTFDAGGEPQQTDVVSGDSRRGCEVTASANNSAWNGTVNGYVDLGTYAGFTPYIGAGGGLLYTRTKFDLTAICEADQTVGAVAGFQQTTKTFLCRGQSGPNDAPVTYTPVTYRNAEYNLMYTLNAGVAYKVNDSTSIDVGYQYMSSPGFEYYTASADGLSKNKGIDSHQIKVGLRYDLW